MNRQQRAPLSRATAAGSDADALNQRITVKRGDHLFGLYGSDLGRVALAAPFLLDGLREGSVCFLIEPAEFQDAILEHIRVERPDIDADIEAGRFFVAEYQKTPRGQYDYFEEHIASAEESGAKSFRVFADMIGTRANMTAERLLELETGWDQAIGYRYPMIAFCVYDARAFNGVELMTVLKPHMNARRDSSAMTSP